MFLILSFFDVYMEATVNERFFSLSLLFLFVSLSFSYNASKQVNAHKHTHTHWREKNRTTTTTKDLFIAIIFLLFFYYSYNWLLVEFNKIIDVFSRIFTWSYNVDIISLRLSFIYYWRWSITTYHRLAIVQIHIRLIISGKKRICSSFCLVFSDKNRSK